MRCVLVLFLLVNSFAFSADFDLDRKRACMVVEFDRGPYHPNSVPTGFVARTFDYRGLSLNDLIQDKFIYFVETVESEPNIRDDYVWRYGGNANLAYSDQSYSIYESGSVLGPIRMLFEKLDGDVLVTYSLTRDNTFLFSIACE